MKVQRAGEVKASTCTPSVLQWQRPLAKPRSVISPCSHVCVCFIALLLAEGLEADDSQGPLQPKPIYELEASE